MTAPQNVLWMCAFALLACKSEPPTPAATAPPSGAPSSLDVPAAAPADSDSPPDKIAKLLSRLGRDAHYGLYLMGRKVGHAHVWDRKAQGDEPGGFVMGFEMAMTVGGGGNTNQLDASEIRFYAKEAPYALIETRFASSAMGFRDVRRAVPAVADGAPVLRITRSVDNAAEQIRDVAPTADTLLSQLEVTPLSLEGLEVGETFKVKVFSWEREADEAVSVKVLSLGTRMVAGLEDKIATLEVNYETSGLKGRSVLTSDGSMIEMTLGPGLVLKLEEKDLAMSGIAGLDILGTGMVSPVKLGSPRAISRLELTLTGDPGVKLPSSPNQTVTTTVTDGVATHEVLLVSGPGAEVGESELADALAADATIDTTHEAIVAKAKALAEGLSTPREKVEAIAQWVYLALDKKLATHLPTASTVLDKLVGDCTEHTWLTVALLRALQIPARPVYGAGYTGDTEGVFAYHAWVEVALDGHWVMIDPTWNEKLADATHLRMGSTLGEVAASMGGLTIKAARVPPTP